MTDIPRFYNDTDHRLFLRGSSGPTSATSSGTIGNGWKVTSDWEQEFGGISGRVWVVYAEQATELNGDDHA
jgi:hypothetical protein